MQESPCDFSDAAAAEDTESSYLKSKEQGGVHVDGRDKQGPCLYKHVLLCPPASEQICTLGRSNIIYPQIGTSEHFKVGRFHEIDHSKLPPNSPDQLKSIRIVMVSDKGKLHVSLRYPSINSLRTHFSDPNFGKQDGKKIPALDEKYVMGLEFAMKALHKRIPTEEFSHKRNSWSFWVAPPPSEEENRREKSPVFSDEATTNLLSKHGSCWSQLKFTGMMQWGKRRQVRFLGRHEEQKVESLQEIFTVEGTEKKKRKKSEQETNSLTEIFTVEEGSEKKRKKGEQETEAMSSGCGVRMTTRQRNKNLKARSSSGVQSSTKAKKDSKKQLVHSKNKRKISIDRWSAERYKLAEENMLKVMKAKGAVHGNPILRPDLRSEARKHIGDTGLLDHLLKHMAGKVAPDGTLRFRRRHNAEGAMEYWLENANLVDIRREAGVQDPYWTPPTGWKLGDNLLNDPITNRELREIKEEIFKLKQDLRELASMKGDEALAIVATPSSCLSSLNLEKDGSLLTKEEIYLELLNKKAKIEEQLKEISMTLSVMEEQLEMLKPPVEVEEPIMSESEPLISGIGGEAGKERTDDELDDSKNKATKSKSAGDIQQMQGSSSSSMAVTEDKAAKIERLKSGFQICKPKGIFVWPNMGVSPPSVVPTPSSAPKPQSQNPSSPLKKPLAERRPVSTATLTHVTRPFSAPLMTDIGTKNASSINLNEVPIPE